jgi:hypothetical protein
MKLLGGTSKSSPKEDDGATLDDVSTPDLARLWITDSQVVDQQQHSGTTKPFASTSLQEKGINPSTAPPPHPAPPVCSPTLDHLRLPIPLSCP